MRRGFRLLLLLALIALLGSVIPTETAAQFPSQSGGGFAAASGGSYESQIYGFALSWGPEWTLVSEEHEVGWDIIRLGNGVSRVLVGVIDFSGTPQTTLLRVANAFGGESWDFAEVVFDEPQRAAAVFIASQAFGHYIEVVDIGQPLKQLVVWDFPVNERQAEYEAFQALMAGYHPPVSGAS